jgi:hypothetical protein
MGMRLLRLVVLMGGAPLVAACTFPDLTYSDGGIDGGDGSTLVDGASAEGGAADATNDSSDASDALATGDGGAGPDARPDAPICDQDEDSYRAEGGACGGNDCCDIDSDAYPGQKKFFYQSNKCGSFDYNCNGKLDPEYPVSLTCSGTAATGCAGGSGYLTDPGCGNPAPLYTCVGNGLLACTPGQPISQQQGCN